MCTKRVVHLTSVSNNEITIKKLYLYIYLFSYRQLKPAEITYAISIRSAFYEF